MKPKLTYNKTTLRLINKPEYYWWDVIIGGLLTSLILISLGALILIKTDLAYLLCYYSALCVALVIYYQWRDDNLSTIETGLSINTNFSLVITCLDSLNWKYEQTHTSIDLKLNKYIFKFSNPTIIIERDNVYVNFKYHSTTQTGRLPFFFGLSTYLKWTFKRRIKQLLLQMKLEEGMASQLS